MTKMYIPVSSLVSDNALPYWKYTGFGPGANMEGFDPQRSIPPGMELPGCAVEI